MAITMIFRSFPDGQSEVKTDHIPKDVIKYFNGLHALLAGPNIDVLPRFKKAFNYLGKENAVEAKMRQYFVHHLEVNLARFRQDKTLSPEDLDALVKLAELGAPSEQEESSSILFECLGIKV